MPKAAVDENDLVMARKSNIRASRQVRAANPKPKSHAVQEAANGTLWAGITPAYAGHDLRPLFGRVNIQGRYSLPSLTAGADNSRSIGGLLGVKVLSNEPCD